MKPISLSAFLCLFVCLLAPSLALPANPGEAVQPEETLKDAIFMGVTLQVKWGEAVVPVVTYRDGAWVAETEAGPRPLPRNTGVRITKTLLHSDRFSDIYDIEAVPMSSRREQQFAAINAARDGLQQQQNLMDQLLLIQNREQNVSNQAGLPDGTDVSTSIAGGDLQNTIVDTQSNIDSTEEAIRRAVDRLAEPVEAFDVLRISMKLRPREDLADCFLLARTRYKSNPDFSPELDPEEERMLYKVVEIGDLPAGVEHETTVMLRGFTPGPRITDTSYHLFSRGREVATGYSDRLIPVSEDEAFDFLFADFISREEAEDLEPRLFKPLDPSAFAKVIPSDQMDALSVRLTVTAMGYIEDISIRGGGGTVDAALITRIEQAKFFPAMESGIPVDRVLEMPLSALLEL